MTSMVHLMMMMVVVVVVVGCDVVIGDVVMW
jgi:hypothetical protein